jgi:uncharacterized protein YndB with AHSA1/START domain
MPDIRHFLRIASEPEKVYNAITTQEGLSAWWTPQTAAKAEVGSISTFGFGPTYFKEIRVDELTPGRLVKWKCLTGDPEWVDTDFEFVLTPFAKGTELFFSHRNWSAYTAMYSQCSFDWAMFLRSLKLYCETGKGKPFPDFM